MNPRTKFLASVAAAGALIALVTLLWGSSNGVVKPLRTAGPAGSQPAPAGAPVSPTGKSGYDGYRLFQMRNVFDPDRRPLRTVTEAPAATPPPSRTDFVALTGVMVNDQRSLAFFSGSRAEYNRVLALRDKIAGAEITQILPGSIEIDRAGQKTQIGVGQTVPFDNGAAPVPAPVPESYAPAPSTSSSAAAGAGPASPNAQSSSKQDELRRQMMERRRQEEK